MPACLSVTLFLSLSLSLSLMKQWGNGANGAKTKKTLKSSWTDVRTDGNRWKIEIEIEITKNFVEIPEGDEGNVKPTGTKKQA